MPAWLDAVIEAILSDSRGKTVWVAYSGGLDSHVLLHGLATANKLSNVRLKAVHINHQLQADAKKWGQHCQATAQELAVELTLIDVTITARDKRGTEAAARQARYAALANVLSAGDMMLTAHHQQDQAETILLQLLRGAGPKGLAAMPVLMPLGLGQLYRPLLAVSQQELRRYAAYHHLSWINDPSNTDTHFDRNYLRKILWPLISERWPSAEKTLSRSARHCADSDNLLQQLAQQDILAIAADKVGQGILPIAGLLSLPAVRARNVLRYMIARQGRELPSTARLDAILKHVCRAREDKQPEITWPGGIIRRYRQQLFCLDNQPTYPFISECLTAPKSLDLSSGQHIDWALCTKVGISMQQFQQGIRIRSRRHGDRIQLIGRKHHHQLKRLWQTWSVPPWMRDEIPLIVQGETILAVVGYGWSCHCLLAEGETGYQVKVTGVTPPID